MAQAFSLFVPRTSTIHRLHPITKLTLALALLVASVALPGTWTNYAFFLVVLLPLSAAAQVAGRLLGAAVRVVLPFAVSVFLIQGFLWPQGTPILALGPLSLKQEGLQFAVTSTGRILMVVSSFLFFALTTRPDALMTALVQRGFPPSLAYIVVTTVQIVPRFQARAQAILDAQRARGLETEGPLSRRIRALVPLIGPLILGSLVDVEERAIAIEARAFNRPGPKTSLRTIPEAGWEATLRIGLILAAIAAAGLRLVSLL
jgi:energy-coupling factor transport system permease protein